VDLIPHPSNGEMGAILEVFNALGESISGVTVPISLTFVTPKSGFMSSYFESLTRKQF